MSETFDFIVVGAGSAGAVIAARLSEDPGCRVALLEAGGHPPAAELIPVAVASMQNDPATDWMYTTDAGRAGLSLRENRMMAPRGKMLGGSSGINYLAYVRGHPGDFDAWAAGGATGWSYAEVLPYFRKSEGLALSDDITIDLAAHNTEGPMGVSVRAPVLDGAREFVAAAVASGIPQGDYNGRDRGGPAGVSSLWQTTTRLGRRASTYHAFLEGKPEARENLAIFTGVHVTRVLIEGEPAAAVGVEFRDPDGATHQLRATREVILSAGTFGSPHLLLLSGVGPRAELESVGLTCAVEAPEVGKHLKDHLHLCLLFPAPGVGVPMAEVGLSLGPDFLRGPGGPLPADPADDVHLPPELVGLKAEAERRIAEWAGTGSGLISSSLYDAGLFFSTGLGDEHTHDAQIGICLTGFDADFWRGPFRIEPETYFADAATTLAVTAENVVLSVNPVQPHSEGELTLRSSDPSEQPEIRPNFYGDPQDLTVMIAVIRRALEIMENWPAHRRIGPVQIPPFLAEKYAHLPGATPSDALLEDLAIHYSTSIYHPTGTCRIGSVVDPRLRVLGVDRLRVADASVMPNLPSGNTNAASIMIGEKAAELIAADHGLAIEEFVGNA